MMRQRAGTIISIASIVGMMGNAGQANYSASKAGVIGLTKSVAKELASRNITANAIAPGFIKTRMTDKLTEAQREAMRVQIPLGRFGSPEDVARAALFLASPLAHYITGQVIVVDGGMMM
jgi:3-oxoacyl-[acyl-carrier protein] reductase